MYHNILLNLHSFVKLRYQGKTWQARYVNCSIIYHFQLYPVSFIIFNCIQCYHTSKPLWITLAWTWMKYVHRIMEGYCIVYRYNIGYCSIHRGIRKIDFVFFLPVWFDHPETCCHDITFVNVSPRLNLHSRRLSH